MSKPRYRCPATLHPHEVESPQPSGRLYQLVRGQLIANGTNLNEWCAQHGVLRQTAFKALTGQRNGRKAKALRDRLVADAYSAFTRSLPAAPIPRAALAV